MTKLRATLAFKKVGLEASQTRPGQVINSKQINQNNISIDW